jgi:tricorn protease
MSSGEAYLRFPTIHDDTVVFVAEDDLWTVPAGGGRAWRLTAGVAEVSHPRLSPDGSRLAFTGREDGPAEVYVMPATGGVSRRLTFEAATLCSVTSWDHDGAIVYSSDAGQPHARAWLRRVHPDGGLPEPLGLGPARTIGYGPGGRVVIGRRGSREPAWWKRYRGGTSGELWVDPDGSGEFRVLIDLAGNPFNPCWVGDRVYFLSDHEGVGNVYSCTPDGQDLRRHSDHDEYYARSLTTDGNTLVYQSAGDLYSLRPGEAPRRIDVRLDSSRTQRTRRFVGAADYLDGVRLNPDGSGLAITSRGKAFSFGTWEGPVRQHGEPDGIRYRLLSWLPDQQRLVAATSDESDYEYLVLLTADGTVPPRRLTDTDLGRFVGLEVAPAGERFAVTTHRMELHLVDVGSGEVRRVDHNTHQQITDVTWSWDGRWLAYTYAESAMMTAIKLCLAETGETAYATRPVLRDRRPAFDPEGQYLYFVGERTFDPVFDNLQWDANFPRGERPYAVALRNDVPSPFAPRPRPVHSEDAEQVRHATEELAGETPVQELEIDLDGIERRVVAFPVPEGRYGRVLGIKGKVLYSHFEIEGSRADSWLPGNAPKPNGTLECFDFDKQQAERLTDEISDFWLGPDRRTLLYRSGDRLRVLVAGDKPDAEAGDDPGRASGWVDLDRVKVSVRPAAEWRQMFREAWRLQREQFWTEDMSGIDWDRMYQRYLPLVDRVGTRSELSDLIWELQGELGTSHAYEIGGEYRPGPDYRQGFLGVDWAYDAERGSYRVARILDGDPWDAEATSPLNRPGTGIRPGDELLAINGQPVGGGRRNGTLPVGPGERLVNQADQEVELTVRTGDEPPRTVSVHATADEQRARYRDWVEANRRRVHEATGGRVGYIHVPDMGPDGYAEFHRSFLTEFDRDGLLVDVRYNRGGSVSDLLLQKLARRRLGYGYARWGDPEPYPSESPRGPMVALTNEWAGSDGDIFSHVFKLMRLGPLIGKRTWGGVVGIWPRHTLADGTVTTQPEYSFAFDDVGWKVENYGTDPDIEIDIAPQDYARDADPQMDRAIAEALHQLEANPPHHPDPEDRPRLTAPPLPPRS